jgi:hypothetical protein
MNSEAHQSNPVGPQSARRNGCAWVALVQGIFYFTTGVWPLIHMRSFVWVTGPKTDLWLVQTVGALLALIGAVLWYAGRRGSVHQELKLIGAGVALVLAICDVVFVARDVIDPIYLLDALAELAIVAGWLRCTASQR